MYVRLDHDKISRFYGQYILSSTAGKFNIAEFTEVWQDSLPDGMVADIAHLRGLALVSKDTNPHTISYLAGQSSSRVAGHPLLHLLRADFVD